MALHTSQSVNEFLEITRRHGKTPIEWLYDIGFLGPDVILGHCILIAPGSWTNWSGDDVGILADTGTNVAHCAWSSPAAARHGELRPLPGARDKHDAGDGHRPQSMIDGLRCTAVAAKIVTARRRVATAADVFDPPPGPRESAGQG